MILENVEGIHERNKQNLVERFSDKDWTEKGIRRLYNTTKKEMEKKYKKNTHFIPLFVKKEVEDILKNRNSYSE